MRSLFGLKNMILFSAVLLSIGSVSAQHAFAGGIMGCIIEPTTANLEIAQEDGSDFVDKKITCPVPLEESLIVWDLTCENYNVYIQNPVLDENMVTFTEQVTNEGPFVPEHCIVIFQVTDVSGSVEYLTQELWINMVPDQPIGGISAPVSTTTLVVAAAQANMGLWSLALVGIVGTAAAITYKVKSKSEQ